jgi:hypothetical protein
MNGRLKKTLKTGISGLSGIHLSSRDLMADQLSFYFDAREWALGSVPEVLRWASTKQNTNNNNLIQKKTN